MAFADLDKALQDKMIKLAMAGKAQTPGNQSKARQLLTSEPGFLASIKRRAEGGKETQVDNATIDHFKASEAETDGPATTTGDVKPADNAPGKGSTAGKKPAQTSAAPSASGPAGKPGESKMASADAGASRGGANTADEAGILAAIQGTQQQPQVAGAGTDMTGPVAAVAGAAAGAVGLYHGVKYFLGKNGEPVAPAPPDAQVTVDSNTGAPIEPPGGPGTAVGPASPVDVMADRAMNGGQDLSPVVQQQAPPLEGEVLPPQATMAPPPSAAPQAQYDGPMSIEHMLSGAASQGGDLAQLAKPHLQLPPMRAPRL